MKRILLLTILLIFLCSPAWAADYTVTTATSVVDGDTFCGGVACTSADTIIIEGGARGSLEFKDFDGNGLYITITNEDTNPDSQVVVTFDGAVSQYAGIGFSNCSWIDVRGDNDGDLTYGIKVIGASGINSMIWTYNEADHHKYSYIECDGAGAYGTGFLLNHIALSQSTIWDTFEYHHNYVHDFSYAGFYIGNNLPPINDDPWIKNILIHHNLLEDCGAYGITLKGSHSTSNYCKVYNNTVRGSSGGQSTGLLNPGSIDRTKQGIGVQYSYGDSSFEVYNNWIEKTVGPGLKICVTGKIYNNVLLGCGTGNATEWGHGISTYSWQAEDTEIYQNTIIEPTRYGVYALSTTISVELRDNIIAECGLGEWYEERSGDVTEASGAGANTYDTDVDNMNFKTWSDDSDYTNDDFSLTTTSPARNAGQATGHPLFDYAGTERPQETAPDDGSYEYLPPGDDPPANNDCTGAIAWYKLDINIEDSTTNNNDLTAVGSPSHSGGGIIVNGTSQYAYINNLSSDISSLSVFSNFKFDAALGDGEAHSVTGEWDSGDDKRVWMLIIGDAAGAGDGDDVVKLRIGHTNGTAMVGLDSVYAMSVDTQYSILATYDSVNDDAHIYIHNLSGTILNGASGETDATLLDANVQNVEATEFCVAVVYDGGSPSLPYYFDGVIYEVAVYDSEKSQTDGQDFSTSEYADSSAITVQGMSAACANLTAAGTMTWAIGWDREPYTEGGAWTIEATFDYPVAAQTMSYTGKWNDQTGWTNHTGDIWKKTTWIEPTSVKADTNVLTENDGNYATLAANQWDWASSVLYVNVGSDPSDDVIIPSPWETYVAIDTLAAWRQNSFGDAQIGADITLPTGVTMTDIQDEAAVVANALTGLGTYPGNTVANPSTGTSPITVGSGANIDKISDLVSQLNNDVYQYLLPVTDDVTITADNVLITGIGRTQVNTGTWTFGGNNCHLRCVRVTSTVTGAGANGNTYHPICTKGSSHMGMGLR